MMIYFTSDLHFCHDKEFIWKARGFNSLEEMHDAIIKRWNEKVKPDDHVYILGDCWMGSDYVAGVNLMAALNGVKFLIAGNHENEKKVMEMGCLGIECLGGGAYFSGKIEGSKRKWKFFMSHYPAYTSNLEADPYNCIINLHGHTHSKSKFFEDRPYMYNVGMDAHDCTPVSIEEVIADFKNEVHKMFNEYNSDNED